MSSQLPSDVPTQGSDTAAERRDEAPVPGEGSHIGRYLVLDVVGRGGMGVVLAGFDPELDRKVAIKLLHAGTPVDAQARLQREARALARLSHPNVIRVHDVGSHDGRIFIAMELVQGRTLGQWLEQTPRHWREIVRVFEQAGEGLAAAHAAGLIHRDFKPSNVLVGDDDQVKVTDFGLARAHADDDASARDLPTDELRPFDPASLEATLTRTGALMGTPAYMAPEQVQGEAIDPRADQFSFCVALYEALAGRRPFGGSTPWKIAAAVQAQRYEVALGPSVPRSLRRALRRGLRASPDERHPDMDGLLRALRGSRSAGLRRATLAVAGVLVAGGTWWAMQPEPSAPAAADYCAKVGERLVGVWDDARRREGEAAFGATGLGYAADTWAHVRTRMDAQAQAWTDAQRSTCEAEAALDPAAADAATRRDAIDRQMVCLHRRYAELSRLAELLAKADSSLVERAPAALEALGPVDACTRTDGMSLGVAGSEAMAFAEAMANVDVLREAGRYEEAVAAAEAAVALAAGGSRAMQAEALGVRAQATEEAGRADQAEREYHESLSAAMASGHHEITFRAALALASLRSNATKPDFDEAQRWTEHAEAALERMGDAGAPLGGRIDNVRSQIAHRRGDYEAAREHAERGLALREATLGPDHYLLANYHSNLGQILDQLRRPDEAIVHLRRALELERARYGARHPRVGRALSMLCASLSDTGRLDEAIEVGTEAVELIRDSVGEVHPLLGTALINLGSAQSRAGRLDDAEQSFLAALRNVEAVDGPKHRRVGLVLNNLGVHYEIVGKLAEAERYHRRAVEVFTAALGPAHPTTAVVISNLASVMIKEGHLDDAERLLRETLATLESRLGPDHPDVALPLSQLAQVLADREQHREALPLLERVLVLQEQASSPGELADACWALGSELWLAGEDRRRAIELVTRAHGLYLALGEGRRDKLDQTRAWLTERGATIPDAPAPAPAPAAAIHG